MIVFSGQISGKCKEDVLRRGSKLGLIGGSIAAVIFGIPAIVLAFTIHWTISLFIPVFILAALSAAKPPKEDMYPLIFPSEVIIDTETSTIISQSDKFYAESPIDEVVKILDKGEWYHIYVENRDGHFICQKDLISMGSLREFEELFKDKIIK